MKNKDFVYLQYDKINWENQEKTKINESINQEIIDNIISKSQNKTIKLFDIGFGIGFFINQLYKTLSKKYKLVIGGCEPSIKNYTYFMKNNKVPNVSSYNKTFQDANIKDKFDFITSIYVFPHMVVEDLDLVVSKAHSMLNKAGKFVLVVANEKYLANKLETSKDLAIENNTIEYNGKKYKEVLHYADIPEIGKVIDYNWEERFYLDLFKNNGFKLESKENFNDYGFICTIFVFEKGI